MNNLFQNSIQWVGLRFALFSLLVSITTALPSWAEEVLTVTVRENQTLRDIAEEYLGNPNLWVDILRANKLDSASDIKVGMSLKIPATALTRTNGALREALNVIDKATMAGARLFAPDIIADAIELRNQAIAKRNVGSYDLSYTLARESKDKADEALRICIANQNIPAEAIINYRKGSVQHRRPDVRTWNSASLNTILVEGERVRTLSESYAGILFRDESRLRLEENSLALIQKMRSNKLANTEDSSITLLEGDLSAFLGGSRKGDNFRLKIPDIETKIRSSHFWVSRDKTVTRFSNYDGELEISTEYDRLVIRKNQGSVVGRKQKKLELQKLLPRTNLISPPTSVEVLDGRLMLEWEPVEGARSYWLEISNDKSFNRVVFSKKTLTSTRFVQRKAPEAVYYWRVAAVDKYGLPGTKSEVRMLKVLKDTIPPYLLIKAPPQGAVVRDSIITLVGESEQGATVLVEGDALKLDPKGGFRAFVPLSLGLNTLSVDARDNAGNVTRQKLKITYLPDTELGVFNFDGSMNQISPNHFVIQGKGFILAGKTVKDSSISLKAVQSPYKANTYADKSGFFHLSVPLSQSKEEFIFIRRIPSGQITEERLVVEIRARQPVIELTTPLPKVTTKQKLTLSGRLRYGTTLRINGREVALTKGAFKKTVELKPGNNSIRLEARDAVKNVTIVEKELVLDQQAPVLQRVELSQKKVEGGELLRIEVYAKDSSRMKRAAPYTVQVSEFVYNGFLILSRSKGVFVGDVRLPKNVSGRVKVTKVLLEDYYGNRKEYLF